MSARPFRYFLRREAVDIARERLANERPVRGRRRMLRRELLRLLDAPGTDVAAVRAFLADLPGETPVDARLPAPTSRRLATIEDVAAALGVSRDVVWGALRDRPLSPKSRRRILACPAFAGLSEAELWRVEDVSY